MDFQILRFPDYQILRFPDFQTMITRTSNQKPATSFHGYHASRCSSILFFILFPAGK